MSKIAQSLSERLRARQEPRLESDRIRPRLPLKPETIFLVRGDTGELPKVVDFGLAKFLSTSQETIDTRGTIFSARTWMWERLDAMIFGYLYASAACTALPREQSPPRGRARFSEIARVYVDLLRSSSL